MTIQDKFNLSGNAAIITGAGSGLGREMALALADSGCDIFAVGRRIEPLEETGEMVRERGRKRRRMSVALPAHAVREVGELRDRLGEVEGHR